MWLILAEQSLYHIFLQENEFGKVICKMVIYLDFKLLIKYDKDIFDVQEDFIPM